MAKRPSSPRSFQQPFARRDFLKTLSAGAAALALAGCGDSRDDFVFTSGTGGPGGGGGGGGGEGFTDPPGGVVVNGQVNLADFGNVPLNIRSLHQRDGAVGADGSFTTKISDTGPQLLFIVEPSTEVRAQSAAGDYFQGKLRGLGLALPKSVGEAALAFGAESTAVAMIFGSIGILTINPVEAVSRINRIKALPSYSIYRDYVAEQLRTKTVGQLGEDAIFRTRKEAVIADFQTTNALARTIGAAELDALEPQGLMKAEFGDDQVALQNFGFRYVRVWRREVDSAGNAVAPPVRPKLANALIGGAFTGPADTDGIMGGANQAGWGNLFTGQTFDPAGATDNFELKPQTAKVEYYIFGPGFASQPNPPALPAGIPANGDQRLAYMLTTFFYGFLPLFDLITGGAAGLAIQRLMAAVRPINPTPEQLRQLAAAKEALEEISGALEGSAGTVVAANGAIDADVAAMRGDAAAGAGNQNSAYIDMFIAMATTLAGLATNTATAMAAAAGAGAGATVGALALIILGGIAAVGGAMFAFTNFAIFIALLRRTQGLAKLEVNASSILERLGTAEQIQVLDINAAGAMVYNREGSLYLRQPSGGAEVLLLEAPGDAFINKEGDVLFQALDRLSPAKFRFEADGSVMDFPVPDNAQSDFATGLVGITPQRELNGDTGFVTFATAIRQDGRPDIYTRRADGIQFIGAPEGTDSSLFIPVGVGENVVAFVTDGTAAPDPELRRDNIPVSTNARYIIETGIWRNDVYQPTGDFPDSFVYRDINNKNEILTFDSFSQTNISEKPPQVSRAVWIQNGDWIWSSQTRQSAVFGPSGTRIVDRTIEFIDVQGVTESHTAFSLNDDGDVVGTVQGPANTFPALWRKNQDGQTADPVNITSLFPAGSPVAGGWTPKLIRGKYIVLERSTQEDGNEVFLFNLGR